jgi:phosphoribosyl-AMP cyclohydrolase / phosphoribosyl-ATP pyrophosphohydrolase
MNVEDIKFDKDGLVPAIVQDVRTHQVLTLAYMNEASLRRTMETGESWFWSRSREKLWHKGETSGNTQRVMSIIPDCDRDAITLLVVPKGPACHKGSQSCFDDPSFAGDMAQSRTTMEGSSIGETLDDLYSIVESRRLARPDGSYTTYLFDKGLDKILKKLGEETSETIIAAKNDEREPFVREVADLIYHLIVLLIDRRVTLEDVSQELSGRKKTQSKNQKSKA